MDDNPGAGGYAAAKDDDPRWIPKSGAIRQPIRNVIIRLAMTHKSLLPVLLTLCCVLPCRADHLEPAPNRLPWPLPVVDIEDENHMVVAHLFVDPGETMQLDSDQHPAAGAGFYEAMPSQDLLLLIPSKLQLPRLGADNCLCALHMDKIAWNHQGALTAVAGLRPYLETAGGVKIPIVSDVKHPRIADGKLYFKLQGHGSGEYWVLIRYGRVFDAGGPWGTWETASFFFLYILPFAAFLLIAICAIGAIRLVRQDSHPDKSFLELMQISLMRLPLLSRFEREKDPDEPLEL